MMEDRIVIPLRAVPEALVGGDEPYEALPEEVAFFQGRSSREGAEYDQEALAYLDSAGATVIQRGGKVGDVPVDAVVRGSNGKVFTVLAHGTIDDGKRAGLLRTDTVRKAGFSAFLLAEDVHAAPLLVLTSHLPVPKGRSRQAAVYLARCRRVIFDVVITEGDLAGFQRLRHYLTTDPAPKTPEPAPWRCLSDEQLSLGQNPDA